MQHGNAGQERCVRRIAHKGACVFASDLPPDADLTALHAADAVAPTEPPPPDLEAAELANAFARGKREGRAAAIANAVRLLESRAALYSVGTQAGAAARLIAENEAALVKAQG